MIVIIYCYSNARVWFLTHGGYGINLSWYPVLSKFSSYTCKHWRLFM